MIIRTGQFLGQKIMQMIRWGRCAMGCHQPSESARLAASKTRWPVRTPCRDCRAQLIVHPNGFIEEVESCTRS